MSVCAWLRKRALCSDACNFTSLSSGMYVKSSVSHAIVGGPRVASAVFGSRVTRSMRRSVTKVTSSHGQGTPAYVSVAMMRLYAWTLVMLADMASRALTTSSFSPPVWSVLKVMCGAWGTAVARA